MSCEEVEKNKKAHNIKTALATMIGGGQGDKSILLLYKVASHCGTKKQMWR